MIAIQLRFPARRFHATPWGRQVNEGAVEWPPSPWRLLRALISVWHHKCPDVPEEDMRRLVAALTPAPSFRLPAAGQGHTRHYMPAANDERTKIFDTFISVDAADPLTVLWPEVSLDEGQQMLLRRLLTSMTYFGRAESWVCADLAEEWDGEVDAFPVTAVDSLPDGAELVRVLAPADEPSHAAWRTATHATQRQRAVQQEQHKARSKGKPIESVKLSKKHEAAIEAGLPESVFDALQFDTNQLRGAGWNLPPGSRWISYARPADAFAPKPRQRRTHRKPSLPTVARFALCGAVRPRLTEALWIGERARIKLMGCSKRISPDGNSAPVFSGKDADGMPLNGERRHAHYLCEAPRHDGRITHLTVCAPMGFTRDDERALSRLRSLWGSAGHDLQLVLLGIGQPEDFGGSDEKTGRSRILDVSRRWISRTPFVLTRHLKLPRQAARNPELRAEATVQELKRAVRLELERRPQFRHVAATVEIEPRFGPKQCGTKLGGHDTRWLEFRRERKNGGGRHAGTMGYGFVLTFPEPIRGPIVLGYGSHFGLGQFIPVDPGELEE